MLTQVINLILLSIPLILLPILLGMVINRYELDLPHRWWLGFLLISLTLIVFHALGVPPTTYFPLILTIILTLLLWQRGKLIQGLQKTKTIWKNPITWTWIMIALFIFIFGWVEIKTQPVSGADTLAIWLNKAKSIYAGKPFGALTIVQYPNLGPIFWTFATRFTGSYEPIYSLYLGPVAYGFWILAHLSLFKQKNNWIIPVIILSTSILFYDKAVYNGYQDKLLMMCAGMAVLTFTRFFLKSMDAHQISIGQFNLFWLGTFFTGMLSFIKTEGTIMGLIIFSGALLVATCCYSRGRRSDFFRVNYPVIFIFIILILIWPLILYFGNVDLTKAQGDNLTLQSGLDLLKNLDRFPIIALRHLNYYEGILPAFIVSILLTIFACREIPKLRIVLSYLWLIWLVHFVFITFVFMVTRAPLGWHLNTAFDRLSSQHEFIYPLIILIVISDLLNKDQVSSDINPP